MVEHQHHHSKVEALSLAPTSGSRSLAGGDKTEVEPSPHHPIVEVLSPIVGTGIENGKIIPGVWPMDMA
jgi:hypothetical protein